MHIAIGSDHTGFALKGNLIALLEKAGHEVIDLGCDSEERVDYPEFAEKVASSVARGDADRGILLGDTGIGMALAADKVAGTRAATITTPEFADLFRRHDDGNVICLSARYVEPAVNRDIVRVFLTSEFEGGRLAQRVAAVMKLDTTGKREPGKRPPVMPINR